MILGLGVPELVIILVVILVIFGPKNLPKLGSSIGKTVKNIREGMGSEDKQDKPADDAQEVVAEEDSDVEDAAKEEPEAVFCPKCGTKNAADAAFCTKCGAALKSDEDDKDAE
jgi:sec-independent protein translocase protein TatA